MNREKLRNMVLFIVNELPGIGSVKLQKALLFADRFSYASTGTSVSGCNYVRREFGPTLEREGFFQIQEMIYNEELEKSRDGKTDRHTTRIAPNLLIFSDEEFESLKYSIKFVRQRSASNLSDITHDSAWETTKDGDIIDYATAVVWKITDRKPVSPAIHAELEKMLATN
jgi:hypothetical protein